MKRKLKLGTEELFLAARRALAFAYAAIDNPSQKAVASARQLVLRVLKTVDKRLLGGEVAELFEQLERVALQLRGLEAAQRAVA